VNYGIVVNVRRSTSLGLMDAFAEAPMLSSTERQPLVSYDLPETWGALENPYGERIRLGLDADDVEAPQLCIDYLPNGRVASGTVVLDPAEGQRLALEILRLASVAQGCSTAALLSGLLASESAR
jgi:hypothetical protein